MCNWYIILLKTKFHLKSLLHFVLTTCEFLYTMYIIMFIIIIHIKIIMLFTNTDLFEKYEGGWPRPPHSNYAANKSPFLKKKSLVLKCLVFKFRFYKFKRTLCKHFIEMSKFLLQVLYTWYSSI